MSPKLAYTSLRIGPEIPKLTVYSKDITMSFRYHVLTSSNFAKHWKAVQKKNLPCVKQPVLQFSGNINSPWLRILLETRFSLHAWRRKSTSSRSHVIYQVYPGFPHWETRLPLHSSYSQTAQ